MVERATAAGRSESQDDLFATGKHPLPTCAAAQALIQALQPGAYARTRNALGGAVSGLSPYITHGIVTLPQVLSGVLNRHALDVQHKFVFELGWREFFRQVWQHRGQGILQSLHVGVLPDEAYAGMLPDDIRTAATGVPAIDAAVRTLYASGLLHNHARMWLASYVVHVRKVHWRVGADWMFSHLLDGDLASNHLSWQWVAGTSSHKPYLFNADNVARYAPAAWHSPGTVLDADYAALDRLARAAAVVAGTARPAAHGQGVDEPARSPAPVLALLSGAAGRWRPTPPDAAAVQGRDVWLVHPWSLGAIASDLDDDAVVLGLLLDDFHNAWPWTARRWQFVGTRMAELCASTWCGQAGPVGHALAGARRVRSVADPHLLPWLPGLAHCAPAPVLFGPVARRCDSFSQWWAQATRGVKAAEELLQRPRSRPQAELFLP